jgi:NADH:ubiquinone oxidoreductase subunit H
MSKTFIFTDASFVSLVCGFDLVDFYYFQHYLWLIFLRFLCLCMIYSLFSCANRTPFDFAEGES